MYYLLSMIRMLDGLVSHVFPCVASNATPETCLRYRGSKLQLMGEFGALFVSHGV